MVRIGRKPLQPFYGSGAIVDVPIERIARPPPNAYIAPHDASAFYYDDFPEEEYMDVPDMYDANDFGSESDEESDFMDSDYDIDNDYEYEEYEEGDV